jgi:VIT1/CCC1 family predicted Fe2+/Mn2+ transporter
MTLADANERMEIHHSHRDVTGGWLRPAVFGVMDGLVSNMALVAGVVGGGSTGKAVVVTGLAGLVAGACSMASGEYTSVASQTEAAQAEIAIERVELKRNPGGELAELTRIYMSRGLDADLAHQVAVQLSKDPEIALRVHVRDELGVDPDDLPSAWIAAASSFAAFSLGAFVPVLPYLLGAATLWPALLLCALALFGTGALVARITVLSGWMGGGRQLVLGAGSAAVTFVVGWLVGVGIA